MDLLDRIRQIESKYGSVMDAPDSEIRQLQEFARPYYKDDPKDSKKGITWLTSKQRAQQLDETFARFDTAAMTVNELVEVFNQDSELTYEGKFSFNHQNMYQAIKKRGLPYKKMSKGRPKNDPK